MSTLFDASLLELAAPFARLFLSTFFVGGIWLAVDSGDGPFRAIDPLQQAYHDTTGCVGFKFVSRGTFIMAVKAFPGSAVNFITKFTASDQFDKVFQEGMRLVEETANYLDGPGRVDSRILDRLGAIAYATESMRLTTRLMQLASWLLLQRAIASGELTFEDAGREKLRINLAEIGRGEELEGSSQLPEGLNLLIDRSVRLLERVRMLDVMLTQAPAETRAAASPVSEQLDQLARAFATR
jgi:regulator of CtrA degradation